MHAIALILRGISYFFHQFIFTAPLPLTEALQFDGVVVCPLLTVALITGLGVQTVAILADLLSKK